MLNSRRLLLTPGLKLPLEKKTLSNLFISFSGTVKLSVELVALFFIKIPPDNEEIMVPHQEPRS